MQASMVVSVFDIVSLNMKGNLALNRLCMFLHNVWSATATSVGQGDTMWDEHSSKYCTAVRAAATSMTESTTQHRRHSSERKPLSTRLTEPPKFVELPPHAIEPVL